MLTEDDPKAEVAKLKAKMEFLKVSEKGAVSVYGMGRFPVTTASSKRRTDQA